MTKRGSQFVKSPKAIIPKLSAEHSIFIPEPEHIILVPFSGSSVIIERIFIDVPATFCRFNPGTVLEAGISISTHMLLSSLLLHSTYCRRQAARLDKILSENVLDEHKTAYQ
jgi:hypothetical protein